MPGRRRPTCRGASAWSRPPTKTGSSTRRANDQADREVVSRLSGERGCAGRRAYRSTRKRPRWPNRSWQESGRKRSDLSGHCCDSSQTHPVRRVIGQWGGSRYRPPTDCSHGRKDYGEVARIRPFTSWCALPILLSTLLHQKWVIEGEAVNRSEPEESACRVLATSSTSCSSERQI